MSSTLTDQKIALVYDWVDTPHGGAEKVLLALHKLFPDAPLYTSIYDQEKAPWAKNFTVKASFLNKLPILGKNHKILAPLMPLAFESFDFSDFDLVISVTSSDAKGIITKPETKHLCYLLSPPRHLYSHKRHFQNKHIIFKVPIMGWIARILLSYLQKWDQVAIHRPDKIIPISKLVGKRAEKYYAGQTIKIEDPIYPTVQDFPQLLVPTDAKSDPMKSARNQGQTPKDYFLIVSRLVSYKKIGLAIKACQNQNKNLVIVGQGPEEKKLRRLIKHNRHSKHNSPSQHNRPAKPSNLDLQPQIQILGNVSNKKLSDLYKNCTAVLMPGVEDFGIVALEALSFGKPVIINAQSGASELIDQGKTGLLLKKADLKEIETALLEVEKYDFDPAIMIRCARKHALESFEKKIIDAVHSVIKES